MEPTQYPTTARRSAPQVTTIKQVMQRSAYQAIQPTERPEYWGVDLDRSRRPSLDRMRNPKPWPNTQFPPERQPTKSAVPKHGRPNKPMPPVYGTSTPLRGLSGMIRRMAYRVPDHYPRHWLLMMLGDRVDVFEARLRRALPIALPLAALGLVGRRALRAANC